MIEWQRRDDGLASFLQKRFQPRVRLLKVGDHVAVAENGSFRYAGGATSILQEGDVVRVNVGRLPIGEIRVTQCGAERDGACNMPARHHPLDETHDEVSCRSFREGEQIAEFSDDDVFDRSTGNDLSKGRSEILQDNDCFCAGVFQLILQLARSIERIAIYDRVTCAQRAKEGYRVLQDIRNHQSYAGAPR